MHHNHRPGPAAADGPKLATKPFDVNMPTVIVKELIGREADIIETRQKIEEGIARLGDQDLITRIAEKPEEKAISLARTCGKQKALGIDVDSVVLVIPGYRLPRSAISPRIRIIFESSRICEGSENRGSIIA
jgi:hypothetical protein